MGRKKKGFNWKARQVAKTVIDKSEQNKIKIEKGDKESYDECNALVLPSKKRNTKIIRNKLTVKRILSKTQRKKLEKIILKKQKKENRNEVIKSLSEVQLDPAELDQYTSLATVQTKGLKRRWDEEKIVGMSIASSNMSSLCSNVIKGSKKKLRLLALAHSPANEKKFDPNFVGLESSSESEGFDSELSDEDQNHHDTGIKEEAARKESLPDSSEGGKDSCLETSLENVKRTDILQESSSAKDSKSENKSNLEPVVPEKPVVISKPAVFVPVIRKEEIQESRLKLPILAEEQIVMEAINENPIVVVAGETGSGKTTQVPQFLYEAGYTRDGRMIGITEPRRVAAISMSKRVAEELSMSNDKVSYLIRFEGNCTPSTEIKFMTDGVLLKEIQNDFVLSKYSVIILDEAHERSVFTDILVGLLSRIVPLRLKRGDPLKLIIMSATLRVEDFTKNSHLFETPPPVIKVDSRQFPVTVHFNKRTNPDYLRESYKKICKIHTQLPDGGILVFVTGQQEVNLLVKKLRSSFPNRTRKPEEASKSSDDQETANAQDELSLKHILENVKRRKKKDKVEIQLPDINLDSYQSAPLDDTAADLLEDDDKLMEDDVEDWESEAPMVTAQPLWVLPLFSLLPSHKQAKVFQTTPPGFRLCVIATNVAETSLTIPGVKYVVDTGKVKTKLYDKVTGVTSFEIVWISKAAANQRAGRAGRTSPGHCYRLYSSAIFNDEFEDWAVPEMQRRNVDDLVLQMKSLGIDKVAKFPFPSPPVRDQLISAENRLTLLGALEHKKGEESKCCGILTPLGRTMSAFPVAPRYAKMLCLSHQHNLLQYTIAIVAALSVQEFLVCKDDEKTKAVWRGWAGTANSLLLGDVMILLRGICGGEYASSRGELGRFCLLHGLREKAVSEARKIRIQLTNEINLSNPDLNLIVDPFLKPPSDTQAKLLRQILLCGLVDRVAKKCVDPHETKKKKRAAYRTPEMEEDVFIHSASALYKKEPEWIVYQEIYETNKMYMRGVTAIDPDWLPIFALKLCRLSPPLEYPPPRYNQENGSIYCHVNGTFGRSAWDLPVIEIEFPAGLDRYKWFGVFFLDGSICPILKRFLKSLLSPPQTIVKSWAKLVTRTDNLLKTLVSEEVDSKEKLLKAWEKDKKFLLSSYLEWLPESAKQEITQLWPPIK